MIEEAEKTILIDPGNFSYEENALDLNKLTKLDYLLITHQHPDHMHLPFVKELVAKFPEAKILTNQDVMDILRHENILATNESDESITVTPVPHERIFDNPTPQNVMFEILGKLTHPGDSMSFTTNTEILALPLLGPSWMITQAVEKALEIKPKYVLPIHDWHWKDDVRKTYYHRLETFFTKHDIQFYGLETEEVKEITV